MLPRDAGPPALALAPKYMYRYVIRISSCIDRDDADMLRLMYADIDVHIDEIAADFKFQNGYEIPVKHLATEVCCCVFVCCFVLFCFVFFILAQQ